MGSRGLKPMSDYRLIAITGSIGSGKTTAANFFEEFGAVILDADVLAREAVKPGSIALEKIIKTFGKEYLTGEGGLDRKKMGALIFSDPEKRALLEGIVHPEIRKLFLERKADFEQTKNPHQRLLVYVIPLFFESTHRHPELEEVVVIAAPFESCIARVMSRDSCSRDEAVKKLNSQIPIDEKVKNADYVIYNDGTTEQLKERVYALYKTLI